MSINIIHLIKHKCPNISNIIGTKNQYWTNVQKVYIQRLEYIKHSAIVGNHNFFWKSIIDDMILFKKERTKLDSFLSDIDSKVKSIYDNICNDKKKVDKLRKILEQLILPQESESKSYDRIAEIYAINYLISQRHLKIIELEFLLQNRKRMDCLIQDTQNNGYLLIDIFSIKIDSSKVESSDNFLKFLSRKILNKYLDKTNNLDSCIYPIRVFPVLWIDQNFSKDYFDHLIDCETEINTEFYMIRGIHNITEDKYQTIFGTIKDLKYLT